METIIFYHIILSDRVANCEPNLTDSAVHLDLKFGPLVQSIGKKIRSVVQPIGKKIIGPVVQLIRKKKSNPFKVYLDGFKEESWQLKLNIYKYNYPTPVFKNRYINLMASPPIINWFYDRIHGFLSMYICVHRPRVL